MNAAHVWIIYRKELRDALRDRRTLISSMIDSTFARSAALLNWPRNAQSA